MTSDRSVFSGPGSLHRQVEVIERRGIRYLRFGRFGGWQGALDLRDENRIVFPYQRAFAALVEAVPAVRRFLALGVGTGTAMRTVRRCHPDALLYGVDVDEVVLRLAVEYFGCPAGRGVTYWVGDGVSYVNHAPAHGLSFDLVFVDAYLADRVYDPCLSPEFAEVLHRALTDSGVAACNVIGRLPPEGALAAYLSTARRLFPAVMVLPVGWGWAEQNMLVVFAKRPESLVKWPERLARSPALGWMQRHAWPRRLFVV
ncbi:MAG: spermidine synthase [Alicyclobacillaceae bacterium]|nr:spermidine synthase [Alicyclobacillaceae bacterium]